MQPVFPALADAVSFLAERLDAHDHGAIASACDAPGDSPRYRSGDADRRRLLDSAIKKLAAAHAAGDLRERYAGRSFPEDAEQFKLGGHASELGYVHVDFRRAPEGWLLEKIWVCR